MALPNLKAIFATTGTGVKSVADILASFTQTLTELENVASFHEAAIPEHDAAIKAAQDAKAEALSEIDSAKAVASNIRNLLGK